MIINQNTGKKARITVVVVVKDNENALRQTLDSLSPCEMLLDFIIIKDGSSKRLINHPEISEKYGNLKIEYLHSSDKGIYDAMNQAILAAPKSDYLWFLNAGDALTSKNALVDAMNAVNRLDVLPDLCIFGWKVGGQTKQPWWLGSALFTRIRAHYGWIGRHQSVWFRYSAISKNLYDTSYRIVADNKLMALIAIRKDSRILVRPDIVLSDNDASGVCKTNILGKEEEFMRMFDELKVSFVFRMIACIRGYLRMGCYRLIKR